MLPLLIIGFKVGYKPFKHFIIYSMRTFLFSLFCSFTLLACDANLSLENTTNTKNQETETAIEAETVGFDSVKAKLYGADQYGMRPYVIAFLKTGPNTPKDSAHSAELQTAHMANIGRLAEEGKLVLAGPFYGDAKGDFRGIYIFDTPHVDSAKAYTESDPAIKYGSLIMELKQWYGSAALKAVNDIHTEIAEIEI